MFKNFYRGSKVVWWRVAGALFVLSGVELFVMDGIGGNWIGGAIIGGVNILVGLGLWKESLLIFRIVRMIFLAAFGIMVLSYLTKLGGNITSETDHFFEFGVDQVVNIVTMTLNLAMLVSLGMLWKELRKEKKIKW